MSKTHAYIDPNRIRTTNLYAYRGRFRWRLEAAVTQIKRSGSAARPRRLRRSFPRRVPRAQGAFSARAVNTFGGRLASARRNVLRAATNNTNTTRVRVDRKMTIIINMISSGSRSRSRSDRRMSMTGRWVERGCKHPQIGRQLEHPAKGRRRVGEGWVIAIKEEGNNNARPQRASARIYGHTNKQRRASLGERKHDQDRIEKARERERARAIERKRAKEELILEIRLK
jgi:hypothetical protein